MEPKKPEEVEIIDPDVDLLPIPDEQDYIEEYTIEDIYYE